MEILILVFICFALLAAGEVAEKYTTCPEVERRHAELSKTPTIVHPETLLIPTILKACLFFGAIALGLIYAWPFVVLFFCILYFVGLLGY